MSWTFFIWSIAITFVMTKVGSFMNIGRMSGKLSEFIEN